MREAHWEGYIELHNNRGVEKIAIYWNGDKVDYVDVYINDEMADDVEDKTYLSDEYGSRFYLTLEDYKANNWLSVEEVWPEEVN